MSKTVPDRTRIEQLTAEVKRLHEVIYDKETEIRGLKNRAKLVSNLTVDSVGDVKAIEDYLTTLETVALLADTNQAIRYDTPRVTHSNTTPDHNPRPVWAANRLDVELDHLRDLTEHLNGFIHQPHEVAPIYPRSRRARRCGRCRLPHCGPT